MKVVIHLPRPSEAHIEPSLKQDVTIAPKFYRKTGLVPVAYISTVDAKGRTEQHILHLNAGTKQLRIEKLVEVIPACDLDIEVKEEEEHVDDGGQTGNTAS